MIRNQGLNTGTPQPSSARHVGVSAGRLSHELPIGIILRLKFAIIEISIVGGKAPVIIGIAKSIVHFSHGSLISIHGVVAVVAVVSPRAREGRANSRLGQGGLAKPLHFRTSQGERHHQRCVAELHF